MFSRHSRHQSLRRQHRSHLFQHLRCLGFVGIGQTGGIGNGHRLFRHLYLLLHGKSHLTNHTKVATKCSAAKTLDRMMFRDVNQKWCNFRRCPSVQTILPGAIVSRTASNEFCRQFCLVSPHCLCSRSDHRCSRVFVTHWKIFLKIHFSIFPKSPVATCVAAMD